MEKLLDYLEKERISYEIECEGAVVIGGQTFELIYPKDGLLFDDEFHLICDETFCDNYVFNFGGKYYWTPKGSEKSPRLNRLKYLGKAKVDYPTISFLGIHGGFELLNGSRTYSDWVKKAKFLGVKNLGICEKNTLAGVLKFQLECVKAGIKPIVGETVSVCVEKEDRFYDIKCFVKDEEGWLNLLSINKHINVDNVKFIRESDLFKYSKGLFFVIDPKSLDFDKAFPFDLSEEDFYYQLDTVEFENEERDEWYLKNLKKFYYSAFKPVSIVDAYYLDKEDYFIKKKLNLIRKENDPFTVNQYFKDKGDYFQELDLLSDPDSDELFIVFEEAVKNENKIAHFCNFNIDTKQRHLPRYEMNEEESSLYKDNDELLKALFLSGLKRKVSEKDYQRGLDRLNKEFEVIKIGDVVDYFLILHDIVRWSRSQKILSGIGRGSGGGSLIAYCLDLIHVNPLEFDLLFERFLTVERAKISLPDLDTDLPSERRDEVKRYMEQRFGLTQVCSVGTYSTLQLKALLKDFARLDNLNPGDMNYLTSILDLDKNTLEELFQNAASKTVLKRFVQENVELINDLELVLHQPKSPSIHACATLILPKERDIYHWIPVKKMSLKDGESMLVTEWEGGELEAAGFLKEDILGINQLDKFSNIVDLVKLHHGVDIDIYTIPYDDQEVIRFFKNGWNSDVFHFGSSGLTEYCKLMQPNNINDLVAAIALYRPGSMENNFHNEYVLRKNGEREVSYLWGTEKITKDTFGLIVYQEQVMQAAVTVGGFSLTEADDIRRAMGKKKKDLLDSYKKQFLEGAVKNSCEESIAIDIWDQLEKYAAYGFNKSHAAAYAITGYISQWLKVHYPLEYWITALKYAEEKDYSEYLSEIYRTGSIKIVPVDINKSDTSTRADSKTNTIYWALTAIKQVGDTAANQIIEERSVNGDYFSFSEFCSRHSFKGSKINKRSIENLILSGAFDEIESIEDVRKRYSLIESYRKTIKTKIDEDRDIFATDVKLLEDEWWWSLQQKRLSGISFIDFERIIKNVSDNLRQFPYMDMVEFFEERDVNQKEYATLAGYVVECNIKDSKKGTFAELILENNYETFPVIIWSKVYESVANLLIDIEKKIVIVEGKVIKDKFRKKNVVQTEDNSTIFVLG
jgi:DNA polymerase III subunit alpha